MKKQPHAKTTQKMTHKKQKTPLTKIGLIISIILLSIATLIVGMVVYDATKTYPLGDDGRVVYLGKTGGEVYIPGVHWVDNSEKNYFYTTDLSPRELADYLGATLITDGGSDDGVSYPTYKIGNAMIGSTFYWTHSSEYNASPSQFDGASKKYIFEISEKAYVILTRQR